MNRFELPSDVIKINDKCIIVRSGGWPEFLGLEVEVVNIHEPPSPYLNPDGQEFIATWTLYRVTGPHLPPTPEVDGVRHRTWLCHRECLMKVPPEGVDGDIDVEEDLGGIVVPPHLAKSIMEWLDEQHETEKAK